MNELPILRDIYGAPARLYTGDGANRAWTFALKDTGGTAVNISGYDIRAVVVADIDDSTLIVSELTASIVSASAGTFSVDFSGQNISRQYTRAVLKIYRMVSSKKEVLANVTLDIIKAF